METITHWIDGKRWEGTFERSGLVFDPSAGTEVAKVDFANSKLVDKAVIASERAFLEWSNTSLAKRTSLMFSFRNIVDKNIDKLARLIVREHGKVFSDAKGEIARGLEVIEYACSLTELLKGEVSSNVSSGIKVESFREPLGVVVGITPFNFPVMVPLWMFPLALACGNSFILKPSEKDPGASILLAEMVLEAGIPNGVFNVVQGDGETVNLLINNPVVRAISFVGSTSVAQRVYSSAANVGKRVQALGGAKNHMVVLPDANLEKAADAAVNAAFGSAGERCMALSVLVAVGGCGDELLELIARKIADIKVGPGSYESSVMGPLITKAHLDKVASFLDEEHLEGAKVVVDGRNHIYSGDPHGFWLGPSLVDQVGPEMKIYKEEIFGPILSTIRVDNLEQAVGIVNKNSFGNGAVIFTSNGGAAQYFETRVNVGMVGINVPIPVPIAPYSFGGRNYSRFGDLNIYGRDGVHFYTQPKIVSSHWDEASIDGENLSFPSTRK